MKKMAIEVILHLLNEDPVVAELDQLPDPTHHSILIANPHRRDGRPLHYVTEGATAFIFPWTRISFVEVMGGEEVGEVVEFFRE
jgi:hypothetical protein